MKIPLSAWIALWCIICLLGLTVFMNVKFDGKPHYNAVERLNSPGR